jgi:8-oxo-dGTP pyrophosphatase MutT (NUDIX family)
MPREISAGGVVIRRADESWQIAVIEPQKEGGSSNASARKTLKQGNQVLALPKGLVDPGEKPEETAQREVFEETGVQATLVTKLTDIKYVYVRSWGDKQRVFKIVSFFLLQYSSGNIDEITPEMRVEVKRAMWIPLDQAERKLSYRGEREVIRLAQSWVKTHLQEGK